MQCNATHVSPASVETVRQSPLALSLWWPLEPTANLQETRQGKREARKDKTRRQGEEEKGSKEIRRASSVADYCCSD